MQGVGIMSFIKRLGQCQHVASAHAMVLPQLKHAQRETFPFFHTEPVVSSRPGATIHALLFPLSPELTRLLAHRCSELQG